MFTVSWNDTERDYCLEFEDFSQALNHSKTVDYFVTIRGDGIEFVGQMGVAAVENGLLPDGTPYSWYKRRRPQ